LPSFTGTNLYTWHMPILCCRFDDGTAAKGRRFVVAALPMRESVVLFALRLLTD
jgi:hypothetical protein